MTKNTEDFLWGAIIGGVVGVATTLLLTPASGYQVRKQVMDHLPFNHMKKTRALHPTRTRIRRKRQKKKKPTKQ